MPKESLEGHTTTSGWKVKKKISTPLASGGNFCARYEVESQTGEIGFLKAMDLAAFVHDLPQLNSWLSAYIFEQKILTQCQTQNMTKVVTPLDMGMILNPNFQAPGNTVYYIIFERAEDGDLRTSHLKLEESSRKWIPAFVALHHAIIGINQLHKAEIAHQDIKPSNILSFNQTSYKISDLGRVVDKNGISPFSPILFPGDNGYRPIEFEYGYNVFDFKTRLSCDMFMLGSLVYHLIEDVQINIVIKSESLQLHPEILNLDFNTALPILINSFNSILEQFKFNCASKFGIKIAKILHTIVGEMCHPNPEERGQKKFSTSIARYNLERYIGLLSQIIQNAKIEGIK